MIRVSQTLEEKPSNRPVSWYEGEDVGTPIVYGGLGDHDHWPNIDQAPGGIQQGGNERSQRTEKGTEAGPGGEPGNPGREGQQPESM